MNWLNPVNWFRAAAASVFFMPMVECRAMICRLRLDGETVSLSIRSSAPIPDRASASTT